MIGGASCCEQGQRGYQAQWIYFHGVFKDVVIYNGAIPMTPSLHHESKHPEN
jgi:hypothetical protein